MFDPFSLGYFVGLKQKLLWDGWSSDVVLNKKLFRLASSQVKSTSFIQWNPFPIASWKPSYSHIDVLLFTTCLFVSTIYQPIYSSRHWDNSILFVHVCASLLLLKHYKKYIKQFLYDNVVLVSMNMKLCAYFTS